MEETPIQNIHDENCSNPQAGSVSNEQLEKPKFNLDLVRALCMCEITTRPKFVYINGVSVGKKVTVMDTCGENGVLVLEPSQFIYATMGVLVVDSAVPGYAGIFDTIKDDVVNHFRHFPAIHFGDYRCTAENIDKYPQPTTRPVIVFLGEMKSGVNHCNQVFVFDIPVNSSIF